MHTGATRIVDIIATIDNIAFPTNPLALNAVVEVVRAGEYVERRTPRHGAAHKASCDLISRRRSTSFASVCGAGQSIRASDQVPGRTWVRIAPGRFR